MTSSQPADGRGLTNLSSNNANITPAGAMDPFLSLLRQGENVKHPEKKDPSQGNLLRTRRLSSLLHPNLTRNLRTM